MDRHEDTLAYKHLGTHPHLYFGVSEYQLHKVGKPLHTYVVEHARDRASACGKKLAMVGMDSRELSMSYQVYCWFEEDE